MANAERKLKSIYAKLDARALYLLSKNLLPSEDERYHLLNDEANQIIETLKTKPHDRTNL